MTGINVHFLDLRTTGLRLLLGFWALSMFTLAVGYSGGLTSVLTTPFIPKPIDTIEELARQKIPTSSFGETFSVQMASSVNENLKAIAKDHIIHYDYGKCE